MYILSSHSDFPEIFTPLLSNFASFFTLSCVLIPVKISSLFYFFCFCFSFTPLCVSIASSPVYAFKESECSCSSFMTGSVLLD